MKVNYRFSNVIRWSGFYVLLIVLGTNGLVDHAFAGMYVDESSNGSTIGAMPGEIIDVTFHSTHWRIDGSSNQAVVVENGKPSTTSGRPGTCPTSSGCGVIHVTFRARKPGIAHISALKTVCSEVFLCSTDERFFC